MIGVSRKMGGELHAGNNENNAVQGESLIVIFNSPAYMVSYFLVLGNNLKII